MVDCSVIIPHYNQSKDLEVCLASLKQQIADDFTYEIIVIDNGSDFDIKSMVSDAGALLEKLSNPKNPYSCRNLGIQKAHGKILAFLDAKCKPNCSWLKEGLNTILNNKADIAAGAFVINTTLASLSSEVFPLLYLNTGRNIKNKTGLPAGNLFVRKELFLELGLFKTNSISGNDIEWTKRAVDLGYKVSYAKAAEVHYPNKTYRHLLKDINKYGKGAVLTNQKGLLSMVKYAMPLRLKNLYLSINSREIKVNSVEVVQLWFMIWFAKIQFALGMVDGYWHKIVSK